MSKLSKEQIEHGKAITRRRAINGQPNGYRPITETELQRMKRQAFLLEIEEAFSKGSEERRKALELPKVAA